MKKILTLLFYLFRIFPVKKNKIVFSSYWGKAYGAEGKEICDAVLKQGINADIVWLNRSKEDVFPKGVRCVRFNSFRSIYEQVTARVWVDNSRKVGYVRKRNGQYYIHTWHGGGPCLKWIEKDAENTLPAYYIQAAIQDSQMVDLMVSGSKWRTKNIRTSFWYDGEIAECDLMKNTCIQDLELARSRVQTYFHTPTDCKYLVYAPTFRRNKDTSCYDIDYQKLLHTLEKYYGGSWRIIVKLHPTITEFATNLEYSDTVLNGSFYPQIEELILASEFLVTDYSGCLFDGFRLRKKVILYARDLAYYLENERGMYFDIHNLPAPVAQDMDEFLAIIRSFDFNEYDRIRENFVEEIGYCNENGPELVADRIKEIIQS